ncbi:MAG: 50S ribosomal protein L5 [Parcubacteria group bacterium]|nr:50S ribosomal protein L5 [Parcubacteria group bacterium]
MAFVKSQLDKPSAETLRSSLSLKNSLALPKIEKVVLNMGVGRVVSANAQQKEKILEETAKILALVSGQKPASRKARMSISGLKVREGEVIGYIVTLRGRRMHDFLARLFNVALPRSRDFRGIPRKSVDQHGNLTIGVREHIVWPEVAGEETKNLYGFEITIVPTTRSRERAIRLYETFNFPLAKE